LLFVLIERLAMRRKEAHAAGDLVPGEGL
jgi:hypothetical protein